MIQFPITPETPWRLEYYGTASELARAEIFEMLLEELAFNRACWHNTGCAPPRYYLLQPGGRAGDTEGETRPPIPTILYRSGENGESPEIAVFVCIFQPIRDGIRTVFPDTVNSE